MNLIEFSLSLLEGKEYTSHRLYQNLSLVKHNQIEISHQRYHMASANTPTAMRVKSEAEMVEAGDIALASEESALYTHTQG